MKILVDMNLSPHWISALEQAGLQAVHWSSIGDPRAPDSEILDFGTILAAAQAQVPSVIQVRTHDVSPDSLCKTVLSLLQQCESELKTGALTSLDKNKKRVRILPLRIKGNE